MFIPINQTPLLPNKQTPECKDTNPEKKPSEELLRVLGSLIKNLFVVVGIEAGKLGVVAEGNIGSK